MSSDTPDEFENPEKKSLDQLIFRLPVVDGLAARTIPALHKHWAQRDNFTNYISLVTQFGRVKTGVELEEWQHVAECFRGDMEFLLSCRHHVFWSYLVYQKAALAAVVSFLQRAIPFYLDVWSQLNDDNILELYEQILQLVLRVVCRLITNKESAEAWLTAEHQRELIYKNYLISVPMLFDLIMAVGNADAQNAAVLRRIFDTLLRIEPNYKQDLLAALAYFRTAFRSIQTQAENEGFEGAGGGSLDENAETTYDDVALYTLDCAYSLSVLLEVCPAVRALCEEIKLGQSIAQFYDNTIPFLYKNIFMINESAASLGWLNQARLQYLKAFRSIAYSFIEEVLHKPENGLDSAENFIALLTECLSEQTFVVDYGHLYPVDLDMEILKQACKDLDDFKAAFVVQGYRKESDYTALGAVSSTTKGNRAQSTKHVKSNSSKSDKAALVNGEAKSTAVAFAADAARDIDLEVTAVLDVLPHLGIGFVRRVLSRYDNSEEAIAAILEENLPPDLVNADQTEVYIPDDPQDKLYQQTGLKHFNVYDGDEYDIMTQDNPNCIIKRGKGFPNAPQNAAQLLDDKRDLAQIKHRYQEYTLVSEGESDKDEYEDEYDDSYEAMLESETRVVKSKQLKAGLANVEDDSDDESDEDEDDNAKTETPADRNKNMNFCENPEEVRARYEARRQAKWSNRNRSGGGGGNSWGGSEKVPQTKTHDVVGGPKGQGQDKETLRNRDKKEKHKSTRANHNRKSGAAFKRSKGMLG